MLDLRNQFPIFAKHPDLVYLDSAATAQKHTRVIEAVTNYYAENCASIHRGVYPLAAKATELFEQARQEIATWLGSTVQETIFTKNATEAINLVAYSWGRTFLKAGDRVVISAMEHHSNTVPWQLLCQALGAELAFVEVDQDGVLALDQLEEFLQDGKTKLVAMIHVSNVLGTINPVKDIVQKARAAGAVTLIDGSQAAPQIVVDLKALDPDFYVWTGHKLYGPTGIGVLHGKRELLKAMPPFLSGGDMISAVTRGETRFSELPWKFEAGTSPIAEAIGLAGAVSVLREIGMETVRAHEQEITGYALERLATVPGLTIHGPQQAQARGALVSFSLAGVHPHDIADILGREQICVRAGHHCAQPLMKTLAVHATTRASFGLHTTPAEIDRLVDGLHTVRRIFQLDTH